MAGHEWEDWFEREEFIGQISDIRVQNLQVEREVVQKRTFTRWMNLHLEKCKPPMEVQDLFLDIQDGQILMALLEELSGCKLLHNFKKSSHRIFRLNNIAKVLSFLEERNVKLVSIDAADVADGNSSIILGLIWNIILFFQIKELTGNIKSQFPSSSSLSSIPASLDTDLSHVSVPSEEKRTTAAMRDHGKAIKKLLQWVQRRTRKYGVAVQDFGKSWTSGLAFLAVIKSIDPSLVDMRKSLLRNSRENLEDAFRTAHYSLGIPRLLEPEDVTINPPDEQSIMTYVSQFLEHFPGIEEPKETSSEVISRSVSVGRLSSRSCDSELVKNGLHHRGRRQERPYIVRKDWVQTPPKIFISSVSEDSILSPSLKSGSSHHWTSKDLSSAGSTSPCPGGGDPQDSASFTISTSSSPQPSYVDFVTDSSSQPSYVDSATDSATQPSYVDSATDSAPQPSYVDSATASSVAESFISDSAIGSPDSWGEESEVATLDRFVESRSEGSLCDSGVAWDSNLPPTTPEEAMFDKGLVSSEAMGKPTDEQSPELFIDEGVYSLSSVDSTLERAKDRSGKRKKEEEEEDMSGYILHLNEKGLAEQALDQNEQLNKEEQGSEHRDTGDSNKGNNENLPSLDELPDILYQSEPEGIIQSQYMYDQVTPEPLHQTEEKGSSDMSIERKSECVKIDYQEIGFEIMPSREVCSSQGRSDGFDEIEVDKASVTEGRACILEKERKEERLKQVLDENPDKVTKGSERQERIVQYVLNGHIILPEDIDTQSANILEQAVPVGLTQFQPCLVRPSEPGPDQEENHVGHCADSGTPVPAESGNCQILPLNDMQKDGDGTRRADRTDNVRVEEPDLACSPDKLMIDMSVDGFGEPSTSEVCNNSPVCLVEADRSNELESVNTVDCPVVETLPQSAMEMANPLYEEEVAGLILTEDDHSVADSKNPTTLTQSQHILSIQGKELRNDSVYQPYSDCERVTTVEDMVDKVLEEEQRESMPKELSSVDIEIGIVQNRIASQPMDLFYSDTDRGSPWGYPNAEEAMLPEQPEREEDPFSYSMTALQPAPASEPFYPNTEEAESEEMLGSCPDISPLQPTAASELVKDVHTHCEQPDLVELGDDSERREYKTQFGWEMVEERMKGPGDLSAPQERCSVSGHSTLGGLVVLQEMENESDWSVEGGDLTQTDEEKQAVARENMESVRREGQSNEAASENQCTGGLRHRRVTDAEDNQMILTASVSLSANSENSQTEGMTPMMPESEIHLILVLWLVLYCLFVLLQMGVWNVPSLLLNLNCP